MIQRQHERALTIFVEAEAILGQPPAESPDKWWVEWIQIQLDQMWMRYVRSEVKELVALIERTRPIIDVDGRPAQRFGFFRGLVLKAFRDERYGHLSDETLANARAGLLPAQESNNLSIAAEAYFMVGLCHALRSEATEAEENFLAGAGLAERAGNVATHARVLTHLTNMYRRCGRLSDVCDSNARAIKVAEAGQLLEYVAAARANQAWIAWRGGDLDEARQSGEAALEMWRDSRLVYPFQWSALFILLAVALAQERLAEAVDYARRLISPAQQWLPDALSETLAVAIGQWEQGMTDKAPLVHAAELAREYGFL